MSLSALSAQIRPAAIEDGPRLAALSDQLGYPSSPEQSSARLAEVLSRGEGAVFVAESDGVVAGWIEVHRRQPLLVDGGSEAEIMGLVVAAGQRRSGLGRMLMEQAEEWARTQGCGSTRVRTNVIRQDAHAFYEGLGYKKVKTQSVYKKTLAANPADKEGVSPPPWLIEDAAVVLHLHVEVAQEKRKQFFDFCHRAFPIYESIGGNRMFLYEDASAPGHFDEVGYYRTQDDYRRSEDAIKNDPVQAKLISEWRSLLSSPPKVTIQNKRHSTVYKKQLASTSPKAQDESQSARADFLEIREIRREELQRAFEVMRELRTELTSPEFHETFEAAKAADGYRLIGAFEGGDCAAVMGYRILSDFVHGKHVYVDDLVVTTARRSRGIGLELLRYAEQIAADLKCKGLRLCTGIDRKDAQRLRWTGCKGKAVQSRRKSRPLGAKRPRNCGC